MANDIVLREARDWHPDPFRVLVTLGESTTAGGWSSTPARCWAAVLASLINNFQDHPLKFINSGIGANVISTKVPSYEFSGKPAASERIDKHVVAHDPDLLVISYGLNDARGGTPVEMFREELANLVAMIRKACSPLILLPGPYFMIDYAGYKPFDQATPEVFESFNLVTKQVADANDCLCCDVYHTYGHASWMVHNDGIHANDLGHMLIANALFQTLAQHCSGLATRTKRLEQTSERWRDESVLVDEYGYTQRPLRRC